MIATLVGKLKWKDGKYPDPKTGLYYRTRQLIFRVEDTNDVLRLNVQDRRPNSMRYNRLKVGDRITDFRCLPDRPIIDPESDFVPHNDGALF